MQQGINPLHMLPTLTNKNARNLIGSGFFVFSTRQVVCFGLQSLWFFTSGIVMLQTHKSLYIVLVMLSGIGLTACEKDPEGQQKQIEPTTPAPIIPAPKLNNDASAYAQHAYQLMNDLDELVLPQNAEQLETSVRRPLRELSIDWRVNVKMTDSVTEGKYALCRKALTSLDIWARETAEQRKIVADKQANYQRDKNLCLDALSNPELGNTDPKK